MFITRGMASKFGPKFAVKARFVPDWNTPAQMKNATCVVEDSNGWALMLEMHNEIFLNQLSESANQWHWIFLAQVLKEDEESLFAFESLQQRNLFALIKELPSLGPKKAASILGKLGVEGVRALLFGENPKMFKVAGVGPKGLAQFAQGLQNNKQKFLPVLEANAESSIKAETPHLTEDQSKKASRSEAPKSRITLSPALLKGLERLGISSEDAFTLYQNIVNDGIDLSEMDQAALLQKMLMKWGDRGVRRAEFEGGV